ncbi:unnamed protein product [Alternaria sp. RS040]
MFIVSSWYRRGEQSKRFLAFHSAGIFSGAVGSILAGSITGGLDGSRGIEGWPSINGAANLAQLYATEIITVSKPPLAVMGFQVFSGLFAIGAMIYLACFFIYQKWPYKSTQTA